MKARLVSAVVIAVVCAGVTSCSALGSNSPTAASSSSLGGSAAPDASGSALDSPPDSPSATATATPMRSVTARPSPTTHHSATAHATPTASKSAKPKSSPSSGSGAGSGSFTVPGIPGDNVLSAYGSYTKINSARVKVTICVKQLAKAFAVGAEAVVYNSSGASQNIGAIVLSGSGQTSDCSTLTFLLYTAHLKVHSYIGSNGSISKTGPVKTIY